MLISNMYDAAFATQGGTTSSAQTQVVQNWITFIQHPGVQTFWVAHNGSIFGATNSAQGQAWLHEETGAEQHFIFDALTLLSAAATVDIAGQDTGGGAPFEYRTAACVICSVWPAIRQGAGQAISQCNPDTNCIQAVTEMYPQYYPVTADYFNTPGGAAVDAAAIGWIVRGII